MIGDIEGKNIIMPGYDCIPPKKTFIQLRSALLANDISNPILARLLNRGTDYISRCLNGKAQWNLAEQYTILKAINRPASDMHLIFPEGGIQIDEIKPDNKANDVFSSQNKKLQKTDQTESVIDQILHTTAETLRLQAQLLDKLIETRCKE